MKLEYQKSTGLYVFTIDDIRSCKPCYDPAKHLPEGWKGTIEDLVKVKEGPQPGVLWCGIRMDLVSEKLMRLFAVWCYRETLKFVPNPDARSVECANVAERFALRTAAEEELDKARSAAEAAHSAAEAAHSAAWSAIESAQSLDSADWSAVQSTRSADCAAWSAVQSADRSVHSAALYAAFFAARSAAAYSTARSAQVYKFIEMALIEGKERLNKQAKIKSKFAKGWIDDEKGMGG